MNELLKRNNVFGVKSLNFSLKQLYAFPTFDIFDTANTKVARKHIKMLKEIDFSIKNKAPKKGYEAAQKAF